MTSTVLFDHPQSEIASLITNRINRASTLSIVTGFATPGGLDQILASIKSRPTSLQSFVVGAATYPGFEAMDKLLAVGVPPNCLHVHLGHTSETKGLKNPFVRYHPMLHSKVYYMEFSGGQACAFIGSHNVTSFALTGLNGEAAIMLEGPTNSPEFEKVRQHIAAAQSQSVVYSPSMKEAFAWWSREFLDGMEAEMKIPQDWEVVRTILLFAEARGPDRPRTGDHLYFEIPSGILQIESLKTETHLFLFDTLPASPSVALNLALNTDFKYTCMTLGVENKQGNKEVTAHWRIDDSARPVLIRVPEASYRPNPPEWMQQVRAEVRSNHVSPYEYLFDRKSAKWNPKFSMDGKHHLPVRKVKDGALEEAAGGTHRVQNWKLVIGLVPRSGTSRESDQLALQQASPESGNFILVSLRRRQRDSNNEA